MNEPVRENLRRLEMACVGLLMERTDMRDAFFQQLPIEEFGPGTGDIAVAVLDLIDSDTEVNPQSVLEQMRTNATISKSGGGSFLFDCIAAGHEWVDGHAAIETLSRLFGLRDAHSATVVMAQALQRMDLGEWVAFARDRVERIAKVEAGLMPPVLTYLDDYLTGPEVPVEWCIPGLLPHQTPTMLTADEGAGKSTLLRQFALSAAAGLSPFEPWRAQDQYEPRRVLLIDCEVSRNQLTRSLRRMWDFAGGHAPQMDRMAMAVESHQRGLDLSSPQDQGWLHQVVRTHRPDLLVIGPVYRFSDSDLNTEEGCRAWQKPLESMLADGVTVLTEHHAPNESAGSLRSLRPIGSSVLRRWFAQGVGLRGRKCDVHEEPWCRLGCARRVKVEPWRGTRDDEAVWPTYLSSPRRGVWWVRDEFAEVDD